MTEFYVANQRSAGNKLGLICFDWPRLTYLLPLGAAFDDSVEQKGLH